MNKYNKIYIGKGTAVAGGLDIVRVNLKVDELLKVTHEWQGVKYLTFELAKMQSKDDFGRTHTAYVSVKDADEVAETPADKAARKAAEKLAKKKAKAYAETGQRELEPAGSEIPF